MCRIVTPVYADLPIVPPSWIAAAVMMQHFDIMEIFAFSKVDVSEQAVADHVSDQHTRPRITLVLRHHILRFALSHCSDQLIALCALLCSAI